MTARSVFYTGCTSGLGNVSNMLRSDRREYIESLLRCCTDDSLDRNLRPTDRLRPISAKIRVRDFNILQQSGSTWMPEDVLSGIDCAESGDDLIRADAWFRAKALVADRLCQYRCLAVGWLHVVFRFSGLRGLRLLRSAYDDVESYDPCRGCTSNVSGVIAASVAAITEAEARVRWLVFVSRTCQQLDLLYGEPLGGYAKCAVHADDDGCSWASFSCGRKGKVYEEVKVDSRVGLNRGAVKSVGLDASGRDSESDSGGEEECDCVLVRRFGSTLMFDAQDCSEHAGDPGNMQYAHEVVRVVRREHVDEDLTCKCRLSRRFRQRGDSPSRCAIHRDQRV